MSNPTEDLLTQYVSLIIEKKMREADVSDGTRVPHGSSKHIKDLETRISGLVIWRDKQKKGSESRANYSRLISRLKGELASARRASEKKKLKENYANEPDDEQVSKWRTLVQNKTGDEFVNKVIDGFINADSTQQLDKIRDHVNRKRGNGNVSSVLSDEFMNWLYAQRSEQLGVSVRPLQ